MKFSKNVYRLLAMFTQFTINMLVPIFLCTFLGYQIDKRCNTSCFFIIFFFIGSLAGFRNVYILAKRTYIKDEQEKRSDADERGHKKQD